MAVEHLADTATRILDAAGAAFAEKGFRDTTVREICRRAEVNLAAVNYHFGDKQRLYIETLKHAHRLRAAQVPLADWPPDTPPTTKLRAFIHTTVMRMIGGGNGQLWQARLMMREVLQPTGAAHGLVNEYFRPHLEKLLDILDEFVPADTPSDKRHKLAFSIIGQCLFYRFNQDVIRILLSEEELAEHFAPEQLADHIASVSLAALGAVALFGGCRRPEGQHQQQPQAAD